MIDARGARVGDPKASVGLSATPAATDTLLAAIARDRHSGVLTADVTEADLIRR